MKLSDVQALYRKRDNQAKEEQQLEKEIFDADKERSTEEIKALIKAYQRSKDKRNFLSVAAAEGYMSLSPEDRKLITAWWLDEKEGKRKSEDTGVQGVQDDGKYEHDEAPEK